MSPQKPFSATLRWLREEVLGVATQVEMASKLGVSVYVYNNWERGRSEPKIEEFIRILSVCPDRSSMQAFGIAIPAPGLIVPTKQKGYAQPGVNRRREDAGVIKKAADIEDPELRQLYRMGQEHIHALVLQKQAGNRAAAEMLQSIAEDIIHAAGVVTEPGISKGRRAKMLKEEQHRLANTDER